MAAIAVFGSFAYLPYRHVVNRIDVDQKIVALTFDDGPNPPFTTKLIRILDDKCIKATFFLIGSEVVSNMEIVREIYCSGHEIGNHSYDWSSLAFKSRNSILYQLKKTEEAFVNSGIDHVSLFRPPRGILSPAALSVLRECGYVIIGGDVVAGDWKSIDSIQIRDVVLKKVKPGSIIILHDGGGDRTETLNAVPLIIDELHSQGYSFLTVSELLQLTKLEAPSTMEKNL